MAGAYWRGLRSDLAGHQSGRAVPDGTPQYAVQRHKAQDRNRDDQAEQSPHCGLLRHAGGNPAGGEGGAAQKPFQIWRALPPELLYRSEGKRPQLLRGLQPAEDGASARRVQRIILCLRQTGRDV